MDSVKVENTRQKHDRDQNQQPFEQLLRSRLANKIYDFIYCKGDNGNVHDIHNADSGQHTDHRIQIIAKHSFLPDLEVSTAFPKMYTY